MLNNPCIKLLFFRKKTIARNTQNLLVEAFKRHVFYVVNRSLFQIAGTIGSTSH